MGLSAYKEETWKTTEAKELWMNVQIVPSSGTNVTFMQKSGRERRCLREKGGQVLKCGCGVGSGTPWARKTARR